MKENKLTESPIYSIIRENGKTLQYVADSLNIHRATLSRKICDSRLTIEDLRNMSNTLGIDLKQIFNRIAP